ncbi:MAG: hypothetical protein M3Z14_08315 [Candidatus Eremiobacteraeota bacterium]|nr:hypothetical protein [Candidatus Eremiobacteraeota bacterium]
MVNVKTRVYYARSDRMTVTKSTMHMCERRAKAAGYHLSRSSMTKAHKRMMKPNPARSGSHMKAPLPSSSPTIQTNPDNEQNGIQTTPTPNPQPTRL